jgi:hypothetical protein
MSNTSFTSASQTISRVADRLGWPIEAFPVYDFINSPFLPVGLAYRFDLPKLPDVGIEIADLKEPEDIPWRAKPVHYVTSQLIQGYPKVQPGGPRTQGITRRIAEEHGLAALWGNRSLAGVGFEEFLVLGRPGVPVTSLQHSAQDQGRLLPANLQVLHDPFDKSATAAMLQHRYGFC